MVVPGDLSEEQRSSRASWRSPSGPESAGAPAAPAAARRASSPACGGPSVHPAALVRSLRPEQAELVLAELTVLAPNGVEEERGPGYVEYAIYGGEGELPELGELEAAAGEGLVEVAATEVPDDWADRWQDFHRPILVGDRLWLRPSWEEPCEGTVDVVVDPGRAFGTGAHPTTRLCLQLLLELEEAGQGAGPLVRPGHRLRRAGDRRREARLGAGARL